ncbi:helix-turn-helix domain-containing protein [Pseudonocardia sp. TRM90224]|uniref:helix-turn-helix domain-containing protein n=1 Tax=Pseudonocardia sp. TRM90224 TaxID=2812678 RepID=UPI0027E0CC98|nr:helix-turn-helix domain-containing protein [Pseudonocardia sp. TRM90224]
MSANNSQNVVVDAHASTAVAAAARLAIAPTPRPRDQPQLAADATLAATRAWASSRLDAPLTLSDLASHARMSTRTLTRRFRSETGTSPLQWLLHQRVELARELLERTDLPMDHVAHRSGLGTADSLRQHVVRRLGATPSAYRATHRPERR